MNHDINAVINQRIGDALIAKAREFRSAGDDDRAALVDAIVFVRPPVEDTWTAARFVLVVDGGVIATYPAIQKSPWQVSQTDVALMVTESVVAILGRLDEIKEAGRREFGHDESRFAIEADGAVRFLAQEGDEGES